MRQVSVYSLRDISKASPNVTQKESQKLRDVSVKVTEQTDIKISLTFLHRTRYKPHTEELPPKKPHGHMHHWHGTT